jgi:putative N6-adenine-specific DNA methylase
MNQFFISCPLGFEQELIQEMNEFWPFLLGLDGRPHSSPLEITEVISGGVEISVPLHLGLQINFFSKIAHRVLLRIASFRAKSFPELKKKLPTGLLLDWIGEKEIRWEIAAAKSKLNNEKRIREVMKESGMNCMVENEDSSQALFVRVFQDEFVWSLDTSGAHLHFRSGREKQGKASLRETYAAYCLMKMIGETSANQLHEIDLLDPMAGTGTFLFEGKNLFSPNFSRDYAFQTWRRTPKILKSESLKNNYQKFSTFRSYQAFDVDAKMVEVMKTQLALHFSESELQVEIDDVFLADRDSGGKIRAEKNLWIVANAPYGERMEADFKPIELLTALGEKYHAKKIGLLLSQAQAASLRQKRKPTADFSFRNSGLAVSFLIYEF